MKFKIDDQRIFAARELSGPCPVKLTDVDADPVYDSGACRHGRA